MNDYEEKGYQEFVDQFGEVPAPISFDESLYHLDLSLIISSF